MNVSSFLWSRSAIVAKSTGDGSTGRPLDEHPKRPAGSVEYNPCPAYRYRFQHESVLLADDGYAEGAGSSSKSGVMRSHRELD